MNWNYWHMMSTPARVASVIIGLLIIAAIIWAFKTTDYEIIF